MAGSLEIQLLNRSGVELEPGVLKAAAERILADLGFERGELGVTLVDVEEMSALNRQHLDREGPTDVISFPLDEEAEPGMPLLLGDVVICPQVARENSGLYGTTFGAEMCRLLVHGILHVAGFDHESDGGEMNGREEELVRAVCRDTGEWTQE